MIGMRATDRWATFSVESGALAGLVTVMLVMSNWDSHSVFYSMSRDGLLRSWGRGEIHPHFRTP